MYKPRLIMACGRYIYAHWKVAIFYWSIKKQHEKTYWYFYAIKGWFLKPCNFLSSTTYPVQFSFLIEAKWKQFLFFPLIADFFVFIAGRHLLAMLSTVKKSSVLSNSSDSFMNFLELWIYEFFKKLSLFIYSYVQLT